MQGLLEGAAGSMWVQVAAGVLIKTVYDRWLSPKSRTPENTCDERRKACQREWRAKVIMTAGDLKAFKEAVRRGIQERGKRRRRQERYLKVILLSLQEICRRLELDKGEIDAILKDSPDEERPGEGCPAADTC